MNHLSPSARSTGGPSMWAHCSPARDSAAESRVWTKDRGHSENARELNFMHSLSLFLKTSHSFIRQPLSLYHFQSSFL